MKQKVLNKTRHYYYSTIFFIGLCLNIWQITIFRRTVISLSIPLTIVLSVGIIAFILDRSKYFSTYEMSYPNIFALIHNTCSYGFILSSIFLISNKHLAGSELIKKTCKIDNVSSMSGRKYHRTERKPLVRVNYEGEIKELVFSHGVLSDMHLFNNVELEIRKGFWGFDIIEDQKLKE